MFLGALGKREDENGKVCALDPSMRGRVRLQATMVLLNSIVVGVVMTIFAVLVNMFLETKIW